MPLYKALIACIKLNVMCQQTLKTSSTQTMASAEQEHGPEERLWGRYKCSSKYKAFIFPFGLVEQNHISFSS